MTDPISFTGRPAVVCSICLQSKTSLPSPRQLDWMATIEMAQCVISSVSSLHVPPRDECERGGVPKPPAHEMGSFTPAQRPGGPADLVAHAVSPICTRPASTCSFGPSRTDAQKSPHPLAFHPQKMPIPPPTPNDVSLERPRNASCWIGSEYHGVFPRSYSGHCPSSWSSTSSSLLLRSCIHTVCLHLASQESRHITRSHTDFGETLARYSGQVTKLLSVAPVPLLHSFDRAEWHSTYIQWLSKKYLHQRKKCAHEPRLNSPGPPSRDLRRTSG